MHLPHAITDITHEKLHTILVHLEFKAILSENVNVFHEYIFTDGGEVKLLRAKKVMQIRQ